MTYNVFNGWNIVPMPPTPAARQLDFEMTDSVGESSSPFTMESQFQPWPGADWWGLNVSMPVMKQARADAWIAWFAELRGKLNCFQVGNPLKATPQGTPQGNPVCDGSSAGYNLTTSTMLHTRGWKPSTLRLLLPGDHLQIGYRLHIVSGLAPVNSDATGAAMFSVWPSIREQPTDGEQIVLANAKGLFRLSDNTRKFTSNYLRVVPIGFKCTEAR